MTPEPGGRSYHAPTETLTFLFTDIEGSTSLLSRLGHDVYAEALGAHHAIIRSAVDAHGGKEISNQGDGFFVVFSSASAGVAAATQMQRHLAAHGWPQGAPVRVRMGLHAGEAAETDTGLVGFEVHRAARVAAVGHGGQVLLSGAAAALALDSLPTGTSLRDLGLHRLKDLGRPEQIYDLEIEGLAGDFPPLRSLDHPGLTHNLPVQLASFVGRAAEVAQVRALVEAKRLVTLTGAGGSGKTRLGLQVAADLVDGTGDGVWLVELAPVVDDALVATAIADTLKISGGTDRDPLEELLQALAPQRMLIVLDNCEHLIGACAKVAEAILRRCPDVHLLATSREPLGIGGEDIYRVPSLSLSERDEDGVSDVRGSDAVALFVARASSQGVVLNLDNDAALVASVCRRLDGMPLAIELAAARLRSLSLADVSDRLDQRFRLLTGGSRNALPRQQTLRATVEWSFSLLNPVEQSLLLRLSVFAEGFDLEAAEAVCGFGDIDVFDVADLVGSLVDKSLVVADAEAGGAAVRYRLLETIRQFAAEHLLETGEDAAQGAAAAHCAHFLAVAEGAQRYLTGPEQAQWLAKLDTDQANLRRALEFAVEQDGSVERPLRFASALRRYWWARLRSEEVTTLIMPVLERDEPGSDARLRAHALLTSSTAIQFNDLARAIQFSEEALEIGRRVEDDRIVAHALALWCGQLYFAGDPVSGVPAGRESVSLARTMDDDAFLAECLLCFALSVQVVDPRALDEIYPEAIACGERAGDSFSLAVLHNNAGVHALRTGDMASARSRISPKRRACAANSVPTSTTSR